MFTCQFIRGGGGVAGGWVLTFTHSIECFTSPSVKHRWFNPAACGEKLLFVPFFFVILLWCPKDWQWKPLKWQLLKSACSVEFDLWRPEGLHIVKITANSSRVPDIKRNTERWQLFMGTLYLFIPSTNGPSNLSSLVRNITYYCIHYFIYCFSPIQNTLALTVLSKRQLFVLEGARLHLTVNTWKHFPN